jgi:hypothetical protein
MRNVFSRRIAIGRLSRKQLLGRARIAYLPGAELSFSTAVLIRLVLDFFLHTLAQFGVGRFSFAGRHVVYDGV